MDKPVINILRLRMMITNGITAVIKKKAVLIRYMKLNAFLY